MTNEPTTRANAWLIEACSSEIRVHRFVFIFVLGPLLAYVLPAFMFSLGLAFAVTTSASYAGRELSDASPWQIAPWIIGFLLPVPMLLLGAIQEHRRLLRLDQSAQSGGIRLPPVQGEQLREKVRQIWRELTPGNAAEPKLVCQPNFRVAAHAYDMRQGQAIEVSAGLASRVVRDDPLATSILRHEVAHLVHKDLPAIRRQSVVARAALSSANGAMIICLGAAAIIVAYTDLGAFPLKPTIANTVAVHLAIFCATAIVVLPLLLGRYIVGRYSAFLVALAEMRADVSAGIWGGGLIAFSEQLDQDPTIGRSTLLDKGLAYVSTALSHFPASERVALLSNPQRLATPKLRYFAAAILFIWLLAFHQGSETWDTLLLAATIAILQALTVLMVMGMAGNVVLTWHRALVIAFALTVVQALPFVSIEGIAYLAESLTAGLVMPGGFGGSEASPVQDTIDTFREFGRFSATAVGGLWWPVAIAAVMICLRLLSIVAFPTAKTGGRGWRPLAVAGIAALASFTTSYKFFQTTLYEPVRRLAFALNATDAASATLPDGPRQAAAALVFRLSDLLNGPPVLEYAAWVRLLLPPFAAIVAALLLVAFPTAARLRHRSGGLS